MTYLTYRSTKAYDKRHEIYKMVNANFLIFFLILVEPCYQSFLTSTQ